MSEAASGPSTATSRHPAHAGWRLGAAGLRERPMATHDDQRMTDPIPTQQSASPLP